MTVDRILAYLPDPDTMPKDELVALCVIGVSATLALLLLLVRWAIRANQADREREQEAQGLAAIATLHADMDSRRSEHVFRAVKSGRA